MSDANFLEAMESCTLAAKEWTHEAHIRLAWLMLARHAYPEALAPIRTTIQRYNGNVLKKDLAYHETITVAFTLLIAKSCEALPVLHRLNDLKHQSPALFDNKLSALLHHYRRETLFSSTARNSFVEPDLVPLPELSPMTPA